jgi:hypothetical protein
MGLSRKWQAGAFFQNAIAPLAELDRIQLAWVQRFELINIVQLKVVSAFYAPMAAAYMTPAVLQTDNVANYSIGAATWTLASRRLSAPNMQFGFSSTDVGKTVGFRSGASSYLGIIDSFVNTGIVTLTGNALPLTDLASIDDIMTYGTRVSSDIIALAGLSIMRAGDQIKLNLESSATTDVIPVTLEELQHFKTTDPRHSKAILWCYSGDYLLLRTALSNYGTLLLRYPRVPQEPFYDTDYLDLPDGPAVDLAMTLLRKLIADRFLTSKIEMMNEIASGVEAVAQNYGLQVNKEDMKRKVEALK